MILMNVDIVQLKLKQDWPLASELMPSSVYNDTHDMIGDPDKSSPTGQLEKTLSSGVSK